MRLEQTTNRIEDLALRDIAVMLPLNNANAEETSLLDEAGMQALIETSFFARGTERGATALLIALDQNAPYINPNFNWFQQRRSSFVYIDRVIVAQSSRGQGIARRLYLDLFAAAKEAGHDRVVCEVNIAPPNPASEAFHASMGFLAVGDASIHDGKKTVRYFEKLLS